MTPTTPEFRYPIDGRAERILSAALIEFGRRGFRAARLNVIARRAGVSAATLHRYFATKDDLFREVVRSAVVAQIQESADGTAGGVDPTDAVARFEAFATGFWRSMDGPERAALLRLAIAELPLFPELALFHTTEVVGRAAKGLERILVEGIASGQLDLPDPRATARVAVATIVTHALWLANPGLYGGLTGADRVRAEESVMNVLVSTLRVRAA